MQWNSRNMVFSSNHKPFFCSLKHVTVNLSDIKMSHHKSLQYAYKDARPKWESYRKTYCRKRRHALQDGIKLVKKRVEGDREKEKERDHRSGH